MILLSGSEMTVDRTETNRIRVKSRGLLLKTWFHSPSSVQGTAGYGFVCLRHILQRSEWRDGQRLSRLCRPHLDRNITPEHHRDVVAVVTAVKHVC